MSTIEKETKNSMCVFEFYDGDKIPICYNKIDTKMIFNRNKMILARKAWLVIGGITHRPSNRFNKL